MESGTWLSDNYVCGVQMSGNRQDSFKNKPHFEDGATDLGPLDIIDLQTPKDIGKASYLGSPQKVHITETMVIMGWTSTLQICEIIHCLCCF